MVVEGLAEPRAVLRQAVRGAAQGPQRQHRARGAPAPAGLVVEVENGTKIYFAGDTCIFGDMQLIGRIYEPDVAVLPIGDHYTMGPKEAAVALELLAVRRCIPCHYGTFPLIETDTDAFKHDVQQAGYAEVVVLDPGGTHAL